MKSNPTIAGLAMDMVQSGMALGLGGGSTIAGIIPALADEIKNGLSLELFTSSDATKTRIRDAGLYVHDQGHAKKLDIYFDGCDQFDQNLNALKSGGGIHTHEKILASMADQFVIVADEKKQVEFFEKKFPLVIDLLPESRDYIPPRIESHFPGSVTKFREQNGQWALTSNGNLLLEIWFESWPALSGINAWLKTLPGLIESSLFYSMASSAIVGSQDGARLIVRTG